MQRLIQRQFLRLRGWREHYTRRTMKRTGCSRSEVTVLDEDFAEFASAQYMSGPAQRVLVPYRGRTYMASLAFTSQQVFIAQLNSQWVPRRISDSNTHGIFRLFKYLFAVRLSVRLLGILVTCSSSQGQGICRSDHMDFRWSYFQCMPGRSSWQCLYSKDNQELGSVSVGLGAEGEVIQFSLSWT